MDVSIPLPSDFSFMETIRSHGWPKLLPFTWIEASQTLERVQEFPRSRPVLLSIRADESEVVATTSQNVLASDVVDAVSRMLQLPLPMQAFHQFCSAFPELCHIPGRKQGRMLISPTVWEDCCKVILTTNTTWTQTKAMAARVVSGFGSPLPDDLSRHTFPMPAQIAAVSLEQFSAQARLGYRAAAVHSLAVDVCEGRTDLEALRDPSLDAQTLWKRLLGLRGVGPYAAACLMLYLGRPERVNADSWARMLLGKELGRAVTDNEVRDFFAGYGPWRGLVYNFYPWRPEESA